MSELFSGNYSFNKNSLENMNGLPIDIMGLVSNKIFFNKDSHYGVYVVKTEEYGYVNIQAVYENGLSIGQTYNFVGKVIDYKDETQIRATYVVHCKPVSKLGIISYLRTLPGLLGRADVIYQEFGKDSLDTMINNPKLVSDKIRGISYKSVLKWQSKLIELGEEQNIYTTLLSYGLKQKHIKTLIEKYKEKTLHEINKNPYILCKEIHSFSFKKADKVALEMGIEPNNRNRIGEALKYCLEFSKMGGHCYLPIIYLYPLVSNVVDLKLNLSEMEEIYLKNKHKKQCSILRNNKEYTININDLKECIYRYKTSKTLNEKESNMYYLYSLKDSEFENAINFLKLEGDIVYENDNVYLTDVYRSEIDFANCIKKLNKYRKIYSRELVEKVLDEICLENGYKLEYMQREACIEFNMYGSGVYILNGPAGTGKTFTLKVILELSKRLNNDIDSDFLALAPTGKATKVVSSSINKKCLTIHRALGLNFDNKEKKHFEDIDENRIMCDEVGMLDVEIGSILLKSIKDKSKLFLLGDVHQLLSVGPGNVLRDLIESKLIKVVTLNVQKRQGKGSEITYNGNKVLNGKMINLGNDNNDFFFLERNDNYNVLKTIVDSFKRFLTYKEYSLEDIQVLIPQKKGEVGMFIVNFLLQKELNKGVSKNVVLKRVFTVSNKEYKLYLKEGDKVMHIKNNYEIKLFEKLSSGDYEESGYKGLTNGECGIIEEIICKKGVTRIVVKYDSGYAMYENTDELELNYATTFHKSQGSSWKVIIMPIIMDHKAMLSKNLFYTGITRASEKCVVIGSKDAVIHAISCDTISQRYTTLKQRLLLK